MSSHSIPQFTHLHLHTEYSLLDGANKIKALAKKVKELGMTSVAMTDHGNMFGTIDFYNTMKKEGIKPIIGIETYLHNQEDFLMTNQYFLILVVLILLDLFWYLFGCEKVLMDSANQLWN